MRSLVVLSLLLAPLPLGGCGGSEEPTEGATQGDSHASTGGERDEEPDGVSIEGLMGTLSASEVQNGLAPKEGAFTRCFARRWNDVDIVAGRIQLSFRVRTNGEVLWVYPSVSTIGDRVVEKCVLDTAQHTRFHEPHGNGEAEFSWGFEMPLPDDVRPAVDLGTPELGELAESLESLRSDCSPEGPVDVTAYVARGGGVLAVGASTTSREASAQLDCITDAVRTWPLENPGSYTGRVTFSVQ